MARSTWNPPSPFQSTTVEWEGPPPPARLEVIEDDSRGILSENSSPDVPFRWGVNPYRGCTHACAYCYARRFHELLGYGAGTDFETRIVVKRHAPALLEAAFRRPSWRGERVVFSGATDCYQPLERRYRLTRACLEVCARFRNPVSILTRSPLVVRDLDVLQELHRHRLLGVSFSLPILDRATCQALEPGASLPKHRLRAIEELSLAGIPVGVSIAPVIPGLNDQEVPSVLRAARAAGARFAWMGLVRLSPCVAVVFERRLRSTLGDIRANRVMGRTSAARSGQISGRRTGAQRMSGPGASWEATKRLFEVWHARLGFEEPAARRSPSPFRVPGQGRQLGLFGDKPAV